MLDVNVLPLPDVLRLVAIHIPPTCKWTFSDFISEFSLDLENLVYANGRLIIVGDFNIHVDDRDAEKFLDLLYSLGLTQNVTYPTHDKGHVHDLIITRIEDACVTGKDYDWRLPRCGQNCH